MNSLKIFSSIILLSMYPLVPSNLSKIIFIIRRSIFFMLLSINCQRRWSDNELLDFMFLHSFNQSFCALFHWIHKFIIGSIRHSNWTSHMDYMSHTFKGIDQGICLEKVSFDKLDPIEIFLSNHINQGFQFFKAGFPSDGSSKWVISWEPK